MGRFYNKLILNEDEITIEINKIVANFLTYLFYPVILFCILICYIVIKYENGILRYVVIPFCIVWLIVYRIKQKSMEDKQDTFILKVNSNSIKYYVEKELVEIPIRQIMQIEDKSYYLDFEARHRWKHQCKIKLKCGENFINNNSRKSLIFLAYRYFKDEDCVEITISDLRLKHEDYLKLLECIEEKLENII